MQTSWIKMAFVFLFSCVSLSVYSQSVCQVTGQLAVQIEICNETQHTQPGLPARVCPNPSSGGVAVCTNFTEPFEGAIVIYDASSKIVYRSKHNIAQGEQMVKINMHVLPTGKYHLLLSSPNRKAGSNNLIPFLVY